MLALVAGLGVSAPAADFPGRPDPSALLGQAAPSLDVGPWLNSTPLGPEELAGRVLLVRWWTDTCPFCAKSATALRELDRKYRERGLLVIGVFHPKPPGDVSVDRARRAVKRFGFDFPVALDPHWRALQRWWFDHVGRTWTSISFLVDREGVIRYVHPGGEYHLGEGGSHWRDHATCRREYRQIEALIERLLEE